MQKDATVTAADIARLADVGRAAVSNWRRRHDDFPEPVGGTASSPSFSLHEVREWLRAQGKLKRETSGESLWQELRRAADGAALADVLVFAGTFLLYLRDDPDGWRALAARDDRDVLDVLDGLPGAVPPFLEARHVPLVRGLADLAREGGITETFEFLRRRYFELHKRRVHEMPEPVVKLVWDLAGTGAATVLDPACGAGGLLLGGAGRQGVELLAGQEADETTARLTAVRLALRTARADVRAGDALRHDAFAGLEADLVVTSPPFNDRNWGYDELTADPRWEYGLPPRMESELAWAQHALARTRPGGTAVLLMPPAAAGRRSGRRIRARLLRGGVLRAVIGLPVGAVPNMAVPLSIWLLRRPAPGDPRTDHVLMAVTDDLGAPAVDAWRRFRRKPGEYDAPGVGRSVRIIDLLDDEVDLDPGRHVEPAARREFAAVRDGAADLAAELARSVPDLVGGDPCPRSVGTFGEHAKAGLLALHQASLKMETGSGGVPVLTLQDVLAGRGPTGRATGGIELRAGDVVAPTSVRGVRARVITEPGAVLGPHLFLVRPDPEHFAPAFVAGYVDIAARAAAERGSSASSRVDVRRAPLPRLPLDEQRRHGEMFERLGAFEELLDTVTATGRELIGLAMTGLGEGTLHPA